MKKVPDPAAELVEPAVEMKGADAVNALAYGVRAIFSEGGRAVVSEVREFGQAMLDVF